MPRSSPSIPPTALIVLGIVSTQVSAGIAKQLFPIVGPGGTVLLRVGFAALLLNAASRPPVRDQRQPDLAVAALFGLSLGAMNLAFYSAIDRVPLGVAVTLEFAGPLSVAVAGSRRGFDLLWVALAAAGIVLLAPWGGLHLDPAGVGLALLAGVCWACYILLSAQVGRRFTGGGGLALAMGVATALLMPVGILSAGDSLLDIRVLAVGVVLSLFASVVPYSLELHALRTVPTRVFGVLMSLEPGVAALVGFVVLRQALGARALVALFCVMVASIGASRRATPDVP